MDIRRGWQNLSTSDRIAAGVLVGSLAFGGAYILWPDKTDGYIQSVAEPVDQKLEVAADAVSDHIPFIDSHKAQPDSDADSQTNECINITDVPLNTRIGSVIIAMGTDAQLDDLQSTMINFQVTNFGLLENLHDTVVFGGQSQPLASSLNSLQTNVEAQTNGSTWLMLDEEGGPVQRTKELAGFGQLPSPGEQTASLTPEQIVSLYAEHGAKLKALGVDIALAPLADVGQAAQVGSRSYGVSAQEVMSGAGAVINGYHQSGIMTTLKHFPGLGQTSEDSHNGPANTPDISIMMEQSIPAFNGLIAAGSEFVMVGHAQTPGLTAEGMPASLSPEAYALLRSQPGGNNVIVMTDHLNMGAISSEQLGLGSSPAEIQTNAAVRAINAGADMVMVDVGTVQTLAATMQGGAGDVLDITRLNSASARVLAARGESICAA